MARHVNESRTGRKVKLKDRNGGGSEAIQILYADETLLVAETRKCL